MTACVTSRDPEEDPLADFDTSKPIGLMELEGMLDSTFSSSSPETNPEGNHGVDIFESKEEQFMVPLLV